MPIEYQGSVKISGQYYDATGINPSAVHPDNNTVRIFWLTVTLKYNQSPPAVGEWIVIRNKAGEELFAGTIEFRVSLDNVGKSYRLHCVEGDNEKAREYARKVADKVKAALADKEPIYDPVMDKLRAELEPLFDRLEHFATREWWREKNRERGKL